MGNFAYFGRWNFSVNGIGESTDPYILGVNNYEDLVRATAQFTCDTNIYASGDLVADYVQLVNIARLIGQPVKVRSITIFDKDDQKAALSFVFMNQAITLGTVNSVPSISDANGAAAVIGNINVVAGDYVDLGGISVGVKSVPDGGLPLFPTTRDIYVAVLSGGTPTYTASGLSASICFSRT